jgi:hypothetical protein
MKKQIKIADCPQEYLRIRNWEEFQQDHKGRLREGVPSPWIKDYTEKSQDDAYARMSPTERYVLDECRRQRGRKGKNLPNDLNWFFIAASIPARHRASVTHALRTLYGQGFLIPTDEQLNTSKKVDSKKIEVEGRTTDRADQSTSDSTQTVSVPPQQSTSPSEDDVSVPTSSSVAEEKQIGFDPFSVPPFDGWSAEQIKTVTAFHWQHSQNPWWRDHTNSADYFRRNFAKMAEQVPRNWKPPGAESDDVKWEVVNGVKQLKGYVWRPY